jgi:hypothetical protein
MIKLSERDTDEFMSWFSGSKVVDSSGNPLEVYHGTGSDFKEFNLENATQNIIWFTSDKSSVESHEVGAGGRGYVLHLFAKITNPAGWEEYDKFTLDELEQKGYDGAILSKHGFIDGFVFYPEQLRIMKSIKEEE